MKKTYIFLLTCVTALSLASCGGKDSPAPEPGPVGPAEGDVEVTIATTTIETKAAKLEFKANDKMNVFAKTFQRIDAPNIVDDVVATCNGSTWEMSPKVYINEKQKNAFVYAVAPYDPTYIDAQNIPVDLARQVDLMYSGAYVPASMTSPKVTLKMKHALSLLSFNIVPFNYSGSGTLTKLTINGNDVYTTGKLDASSGKITGLGGNNTDVTGTFNRSVEAGGWKADIPGLWVLPFVTKGSNIKVTAVIDGKTYETMLPEVEVKTGWQYIFRVALTNNGLEFDPTKTEMISLNVADDQPQTFEGFGVISLIANGSWLNSPMILGDAVFGTLVTPSWAKSYSTSVQVDGLKSGDKVSVESWNSTGFRIESLDGVETIDISQYE